MDKSSRSKSAKSSPKKNGGKVVTRATTKSSLPKVVLKDKNVRDLKPVMLDFCHADPTKEILDGVFSFDSLVVLASHIVLRCNEILGIYPVGGDVFTPGNVSIYLGKLFAAYQVMCGINFFDVASYTGFLDFVVPGYVGILFHSNLRVSDRHTHGSFSIVDPNYDTNLRAFAPADGTVVAPVVTGTVSGEPIFGLGAARTYSGLSFDNCAVISRIIASAFPETVEIRSLSPVVGSYSSLMSTTNRSLKPISRASFVLSMIRSDDGLYGSGVLNPADGPWSSGAMKEISALLYLFQDLPYRKESTINSLLRQRKIDPFKFFVEHKPFSFPAFTEFIFTVLKRNGSITAGASGAVAWPLWWNLVGYQFAGHIASASWITRTGLLENLVPTYVTVAMKAIKSVPGLMANGVLPTINHSTITVPYWSAGTDSQYMVKYQRSASVTPAISVTLQNGNLVTGTVPATFLVNGIVPIAPGTNINVVPLKLLDTLENTIITNTNIYQAQFARLPQPVEVCPCIGSHSTSGDDFVVSTTVGVDFAWNWMSMDKMSGLVPMDAYRCACAMGGLMMVGDQWSRFFKQMNSPSGEIMLPLVEAGFRDTNYESFAAANQGKNPADSYMRYFRDRVLDTVRTASHRIKPDDLKPIIEALNDTGYMPVEVDPNIFKNLTGEYSALWLASAFGTALTRYGPGLWSYLRNNNSIRIRTEL